MSIPVARPAGPSPSETSRQRPIRSFVRREGRMTAAQRSALEHEWAAYGLSAARGPIDLDTAFGRTAPRVLEIGCGDGTALLDMARLHPENDYLGIEVYRPGLGGLLRRLAAEALGNVRLIAEDVVDVLRDGIPDHSLDVICIFFPDPWPKKRHHKRRLIQPAFRDLLHAKLKRHGRLFIATDWADYAEHILDVMEGEPGFVNLAGPGVSAPRPRWRPLTKYERRARRMGHVIREFAYAPAGFTRRA